MSVTVLDHRLFSTSPMLQMFTSVFINHITVGLIEFYLTDKWMEPIKQLIPFYIMLVWTGKLFLVEFSSVIGTFS